VSVTPRILHVVVNRMIVETAWKAEACASVSVRRGVQEVADRVGSFRSLQKQLERTDDALESAHRAYALAEHGYRGGLVDYLDVLNAEAELLAEQRARALIAAEQFLAHAGLMKALGGASGKARTDRRTNMAITRLSAFVSTARCTRTPAMRAICLRCAASGLLPLISKLTEETPVVGAHPLLNEPALIVKPKHVHQVPDYTLAIRRQGAQR
jgi:Outer membrane efflux protein